MAKLTKVEPGIRIGMPLEKRGWGYIKPEEHGVLVLFDEAGVFVSEAELNAVGYVRVENPNKK